MSRGGQPGDLRWMRRALRLAARGEGGTRPNPPVGAVVVSRGRLAGEGFHQQAGEPHAEILAMRNAGRACRGATLYVTLEPCSTTGRTGPCTDAIRRAGIRRVVAAVKDPNPRHAGRGFRLLRKSGVAVSVGRGAGDAERLLRPFRKWVLTRRPWVTLKLGMTLDGRIADFRGASRWITGPASRRYVRGLRAKADAILVGGGTARTDDPSLRSDARRARVRPLRVVVAGRGRLPPGARILTDGGAGDTIVATTHLCTAARRRSIEAAGARVWRLPGAGGRVSLPALLNRLGREGVLHVLCEGGGQVAGSLMRGRLVDEYLLFVAPAFLGAGGVPAVGGDGWRLGAEPRVRIADVRRLGTDVVIRAEPAGG